MVESVQSARSGGTVQRRGVERRQAILDAAEQILEDEGYEAATLKGVGERAGIPTASVYHYFADRYEIEAELLRVHLELLGRRFAEELTSARITDLASAVDAVIDPMLRYFREHPSSVELWFAGRHEVLTSMVQEFDEASADAFWQYCKKEGLLRKGTPRLVVRLAFEAGGRLFDVAFRTDRRGDRATMTEARRLATAYLSLYAG